MMREIEALGGNVMCSSSRETIMYQSSVFNQDVPAVLSILADTILNSIVSPEELDAQKESVAYEVSQLNGAPETLIPELLHTTAFKGNTLGNPLLCPLESLELMTSDHVRNFLRTWYTPERIVVAGAGMPHSQLVELTEKFFGGLKAQEGVLEGSSDLSGSSKSSSSSSSSSSSRTSQSSLFGSSTSNSSYPSSSLGSADFSTAAPLSAQHFDPTNSLVASISPSMRTAISTAKSQYTGGEEYLSKPDSPFTHLYIAFESVSIHDEDIYALATLQILLGGGGSFSAGGPGKGMYSRLYSNILNQYHSVDYCASFHHCYNDSGLFRIAVSVNHSFASSIPKIIAREFELLLQNGGRGSVTQNELDRAKNQLKSSLVMALESRLIEVEDLGRQVQVHNFKVSVEEMCEKIDRIDLVGLRKVAERILKPVVKKAEMKGKKGFVKMEGKKELNFGLGNGKTTVVAQGMVEGLGDVRKLLFSRGLGTDPSA